MELRPYLHWHAHVGRAVALDDPQLHVRVCEVDIPLQRTGLSVHRDTSLTGELSVKTWQCRKPAVTQRWSSCAN